MKEREEKKIYGCSVFINLFLSSINFLKVREQYLMRFDFTLSDK